MFIYLSYILDTPYKWMLFFPPLIPLYHGYIIDTLDEREESGIKFMYLLPAVLFMFIIMLVIALLLKDKVVTFLAFATYMIYNCVHASMICQVMSYLKFKAIHTCIVVVIAFLGIALLVEPLLALYIMLNFKKIERRLFSC